MKDLFFIFVIWAWVLCTPASVLADSRRGDDLSPSSGRPVADGAVTGIDGYNLTLLGHASNTYVVDATNAVIDKMPSTTISFSELKIGDRLMVFGATTSAGIVAEKIIYDIGGKDGGVGGKPAGEFGTKPPQNGKVSTSTKPTAKNRVSLKQVKTSSLSGVIKSVDGDSFVLNVKNKGNYMVSTTGTVSYLKNAKKSDRDALAEGRTAVVTGILSSTDKIVEATKANIKVTTLKMAANMTVGSVDSDNATMVVKSKKGKAYVVSTDKAVIQNKNNETVALRDMVANDTVYLVGTYESNTTTVQATKIKLINR